MFNIPFIVQYQWAWIVESLPPSLSPYSPSPIPPLLLPVRKKTRIAYTANMEEKIMFHTLHHDYFFFQSSTRSEKKCQLVLPYVYDAPHVVTTQGEGEGRKRARVLFTVSICVQALFNQYSKSSKIHVHFRNIYPDSNVPVHPPDPICFQIILAPRRRTVSRELSLVLSWPLRCPPSSNKIYVLQFQTRRKVERCRVVQKTRWLSGPV